MNQILKKTNIGKKLIIYLIIFSSMIAFVITAVQLYSEYRRDVDEVNVLVNEVKLAYKNGLSSAVWITDKDQLRLMLDGITDLADIVYAEVRVDGLVYVKSGSDDFSLNKSKLMQDYIVSFMHLTYIHRGKELVIGEVTLYADKSNVYQKLYKRVGLILVANSIKTALVAVFFYFIFTRLVTRHLKNITEYLSKFGHQMPDEPLLLNRKNISTDDELDVLAHSINNMYSDLEENRNLLSRSLAEQTLEAKNNQRLFDESPIGFVLADMQGVLVNVNQAYADIIGRTIDECYELSDRDITPEKYVDEDQVQFESLENNGRYGPYEKEYIHKDGHLVPVRLSGMILDRGGESFIWSSVEDISDIKKAYADLEFGQARFASMFESISDAVVITDTERRITVINGSVKKLFGYDENDLLGHKASMLYANPDDFTQTSVKSYNVDSRVDPLPYEVEYRRKDGSVFFGETVGTKITSEDGTIYGFAGIIRDVTERKRNSEIMRGIATGVSVNIGKAFSNSLVKHLANLFDVEYAFIGALDAQKPAVVNTVALCAKGEPVDNISYGLVGTPCEHVIEGSGKSVKTFPENLQQLFPDDDLLVDMNAQSYVGAQLVDKTGKPIGLIGVMDNKSIKNTEQLELVLKIFATRAAEEMQRLQIEEELQQYRHHLEELVDERTQELEQVHDELVRKERLATLGQLTATVSHELRNPLGAMKPLLYVIDKKSDKEDKNTQLALERIDRNINRCDHIIDELLDFARITELHRDVTQVNEWLESVIDEQNIPDGIQIEKEFSLNEIELAVDTNRLRRAVINVVENACHAMVDDKRQVIDRKNAHLHIKTVSNEKRIEITITDAGIGIPKDVLEKVFEPLFSTRGFGVGLGMPTVKQIMEQHGGGIEIDTKEDKGTSVTLWLPQAQSKGVAA